MLLECFCRCKEEATLPNDEQHEQSQKPWQRGKRVIWVSILRATQKFIIALPKCCLKWVSKPAALLYYCFFLHKLHILLCSMTFLIHFWIYNLNLGDSDESCHWKGAFDRLVYNRLLGGSPGLVVMGGDLHSGERVFESQCHILDGHFVTLIWCKIVLMFVWKDRK